MIGEGTSGSILHLRSVGTFPDSGLKAREAKERVWNIRHLEMMIEGDREIPEDAAAWEGHIPFIFSRYYVTLEQRLPPLVDAKNRGGVNKAVMSKITPSENKWHDLGDAFNTGWQRVYERHPDGVNLETIRTEKQRLLGEIHRLVNFNQEFKQLYLTDNALVLMTGGSFGSSYGSMGDALFRNGVAGRDDSEQLVGLYQRVEELSGEAVAYICFEDWITSTLFKEEMKFKRFSAPERDGNLEGNGARVYEIVTYTLLKRWFVDEIEIELGSTRVDDIPIIREKCSDQAFGNLIDYLVEAYGEDTVLNALEHNLDRSFRRINHNSQNYGVHVDFTRPSVKLAREYDKEFGHIYSLDPEFPERDYIYCMKFLAGDLFFWQHLRSRHGKMYETLRAQAVKRIEFGFAYTKKDQQDIFVAGSTVPSSSFHYLDVQRLMSRHFPEVLDELGIEKKGENDYHRVVSVVDYHGLLISSRSVVARRRFLTGDLEL